MVELLALQYVYQYAEVFVKFQSLYVTTSHSGTYICYSSTSVILICLFVLVVLKTTNWFLFENCSVLQRSLF